VIANDIPQTATISRSGAKLAVHFDGSPQLKPIEGTTLQYVVNASFPVIRVDASSYYALENGVWFVASSLTGSWAVATSVPSVIYTIPASSPLHYVTYAYVYGATPRAISARWWRRDQWWSTAPAMSTRRGWAPSGIRRR